MALLIGRQAGEVPCPPDHRTLLLFDQMHCHSTLPVLHCTALYCPVLQRLFQMYNRLPDYQLVRLGVTLLVGLVFGSLAWNQGGDS